jgi:hypothetical protein
LSEAHFAEDGYRLAVEDFEVFLQDCDPAAANPSHDLVPIDSNYEGAAYRERSGGGLNEELADSAPDKCRRVDLGNGLGERQCVDVAVKEAVLIDAQRVSVRLERQAADPRSGLDAVREASLTEPLDPQRDHQVLDTALKEAILPKLRQPRRSPERQRPNPCMGKRPLPDRHDRPRDLDLHDISTSEAVFADR